jgi:soluble lytic murein transglycosylase-like protein
MTAIIKPFTYDLSELDRGLNRGFLQWAQNGLAWVGGISTLSILIFFAQPQWLSSREELLINWLTQRQFATLGLTSPAFVIDARSAADAQNLSKEQLAMSHWLSRKYRVAPELLHALVTEAFIIGDRTKLAPSLILAVMAIESRFNPFAQSHVGAQGLMQVMTHVHAEKYDVFGGKGAAFDPMSNLRVGAKILRDCIKNAGGSTEKGLKLYVGAALLTEDGGYADKVLAEEERLRLVASGRTVSILAGQSQGKSPEVLEVNFQPAVQTLPHPVIKVRTSS